MYCPISIGDTPYNDLSQPGLALGWHAWGNTWSLQGADRSSASVPFAARTRSDDIVILKHATAAGLGAVALPAYVCAANHQMS